MNEEYHRFNESLMKKLNPENASSSEEAARTQSSLSKGTDFSETAERFGTGTLIVQVALARGAVPVAGAKVIVSQGDGDNAVIAELFTDKSGRTEKISLPAPMTEYSQAPGGNIRPYSIYNITVELAGYYTEKAINVPVFDKTVSVQPIALMPLSEKSTQEDLMIIDEGAAPNL